MLENKSFNIKTLPNLLPINADWSQVFNNLNPIDIEIGTGRPHFFFDRALNFKDRNIVGIEYKYEFIKSAHKKIIKENIKNACALHGNAWVLVPLLFAPNTISQTIVNFPDPWWKMRHKRRLVLNEIFLNILHKRMKKEGFILLQTDVYELFNHYCQIIEKDNLFKRFNISIEEIDKITKAKTHREKKCLQNGIAIHRAIFYKI